MVISTSGSSTHRLTRSITHPTNKPIATPPILLSKKSSPASKTEKLPATAAAATVRYKTSLPGKPYGRVRYHGNGNGRNQHEADCQEHYRPQVHLEVAPRGEEGRRVEERREEDQKNQFR